MTRLRPQPIVLDFNAPKLRNNMLGKLADRMRKYGRQWDRADLENEVRAMTPVSGVSDNTFNLVVDACLERYANFARRCLK